MFKPNIQYNFPLNNNDLSRCYIGLLSLSSVGTALLTKYFTLHIHKLYTNTFSEGGS